MPIECSSFHPLPKLIQENLVRQFAFFAEGRIHAGMSFDSKLYVFHRAFEQRQRSHAFSLASALAHQGVTPILTFFPGDRLYKVWLDLRQVSCLDSIASLADVDQSSLSVSLAEIDQSSCHFAA
ncbi:hypothetical protein [Leptolyngbya ohadii]|uniref:hypothetical protein n=1 Tax=Leptolyngbya ohadii TaxID=1962290 RepID=UPI000B59AC7D|nr:hypothetical protein [Leptolyngbya ohadii]